MAIPTQRNMYLKTQVETASKEQLVIMLFDGIIRFTEQARKAIVERNVEDSHHFLLRAQAIIMELICTVDKDRGGELAKNLLALHAYAFNCLVVCNFKKDVAKIDEVQKIYREIRSGWRAAMESLNLSSKAPVPAPEAKTPSEPVSRTGLANGRFPAPASAPAASSNNPSPAAAKSISPPFSGIVPNSGISRGYGLGSSAFQGEGRKSAEPDLGSSLAAAGKSIAKVVSSSAGSKFNHLRGAYAVAARVS
ncbi:MAG: flagellar export chaperone FliS [Planctomycetota bacterium]|nr:flagellar export chaperone FliS [Planctomycetota bacterium]